MATGSLSSTTLPPPLPRTAESNERELTVQRELARAGAQMRLVDLGSGLLYWAAGVLLLFIAAAVIDHVVGLGTVGRFLMLAVLLAGSLWYLLMHVAPLLVRAINPAYAAKTIEEATPSFKNSLINFLLLRQDRSGIREIVYQAVEKQAAADIVRVPVETTIDRTPLIHAGYLLCGVMAALAAYKILSPKDPFQTVARVIAPWADIVRPSRVEVTEIEPGNSDVYYGRTVSVSATIRGLRASERVAVKFSTADGQIVDQPVEMQHAAGDRFECVLPPPQAGASALAVGLQQNVTYRVVAGDAETSHYRLNVISAPTIVVEKLEYVYPPYTKKPTEIVEQQGDIKALEGTKVKLYALANQPIRGAWLEMDPVDRDGAAELATLTAEGERAQGTLTLLLKHDRLTPWRSTYQVRFHNQRAEKSQQPIVHKIDVLRDLPPEVQIVQPERLRVEVPEDGELTVEVRGVDPDFGLSALRIEGNAAGKDPVRIELLADATSHPAKAATSATIRPREHMLQAGDVLSYVAVAEDNRTHPQTGKPEPNVARTKEYQLVVLPPEKKPSNGGGGQQKSAEGAKGQNKQSNQGTGNQQKSGDKQERRQEPNQGQKQDQKSGDKQEKSKLGQEKSQQPEDTQSKEAQSKQSGNQSSGQGPKDQGDKQHGEQQQTGQQGQNQTGSQQNGGQSGEQQTGQQQQGGQGKGQQGTGQQSSGEGNDGDKQGESPPSSHRSSGARSSDPKGGEQSGGTERSSAQPGQTGQGGAEKSAKDGQGENGDTRENGDKQGKAEHDGQAIERLLEELKRRGEADDLRNDQMGQHGSDGQEAGKGQRQSDQKSGERQENSPSGSEPGADTQSKGSPSQGKSNQQNGGTQSAGQPEPTDQQPGNQKSGQPGTGHNDQGKKGGAPDRLPGDKQGESPAEQPGTGSKGGAPQGPNKTDKGEKTPVSQGEKHDGGTGKQGDEGAGEKTSDKTGSGPGQKKNADRLKEEKSDNQSSGPGDPSPPSDSKRQSDSKGGQSGENSGGGKQGAGQSAGQEGNDSAGSKSAADEGTGKASESGAGETGSKAGQGPKADRKTGQSGSERGKGSGQKAGHEEPGAGPQPEPGKGDGQSDPGKARSQKGGNTSSTAPVGGSAGDGERNPPPPANAEDLAADEANLEYAKKATEMVLKRLKEEEHNPDPELLKKLGWTPDDLAEFLRRWEALQKTATRSPDGKRELDEAFRSLGLRDPQQRRRAGGNVSDKERDLRDAGNRSAAPARYRDLFDAFRKGAARTQQ